MLTFGSLFSGIGGLDLGLERAGLRCAWQCEIDDYCNRVLEKHWPDVPRHRDVRNVGAHNLAAVNVIAGGFPCQDISNMGQRTGLAGERSGLWFEFARIIGELRPRYVVVENLPDLLVRGMGRVLGDLAAVGYDAEWSIVSACALGASHTRERVFIVAHAGSERWAQDGRAAITQQRTQACSRQTDNNASNAGYANRAWPAEPAVCRVAYGVSHRLDRLRGLGNAVDPRVAELVGRLVIARDARAQQKRKAFDL